MIYHNMPVVDPNFTKTACVLQEFLKATVDLGDLVGLHLIMTRITGKGQLKFLIAGMGWATAELIVTRSVTITKLPDVRKHYRDTV